MARTAQLTECPQSICAPHLCDGTEQVTVRYGYDRKTGRGTATYGPCPSLVAQGWVGKVAAVLWLPEPIETLVRHRDGLVTFRTPA